MKALRRLRLIAASPLLSVAVLAFCVCVPVRPSFGQTCGGQIVSLAFPERATHVIGTSVTVLVEPFCTTSGPIPNFPIHYTFVLGPDASLDGGDIVTDNSGVASFFLTNNGTAGIDTIAFSSPLGMQVCSTTIKWIDSSAAQCSIDPPIAYTVNEAGAGAAYSSTCTLLLDNIPQPGISVNFLITQGPNQGHTATDVTDSNGQAFFSYLAAGGGFDKIVSSATIQGLPVSCTAWNSIVLNEPGFPGDCNNNGINDVCDLECGASDGPCHGPGCGQSPDCNFDGYPDECDISQGLSQDVCPADGIPDECEIPCPARPASSDQITDATASPSPTVTALPACAAGTAGIAPLTILGIVFLRHQGRRRK